MTTTPGEQSPRPELDEIETRVLGVLVEKQMTTPDTYPLTLAALVAGCNQSTNREPVMTLNDEDVEAATVRLHDAGLATPVRRQGDRVTKFRHKLAEALETDEPAQAVLAVLMLRGPQTAGELRSRTERYMSLPSIDEVEAVVDGLEEADLARRQPRLPGQSQRRVEELLSGGTASALREPDDTEPSGVGPDLAEVDRRLTELERRFQELLDRLGESEL